MLSNKLLYNPKLISIYILIFGIVLLICSLKTPRFTDINKYQELNDKYLQEVITKDTYYTNLAKITTNKIIIMDLGNGIITFSLLSLLYIYISKIKTWKDFLSANTRRKTFLFVVSNIVWFLIIPGTYLYYFYRGGRGDFPPFADSISIPIMQQTFFYLLLFIPLNLFLLLALIKSNLPAKLFLRPSKYKKVYILWEIFFICFLLIDIMCLILFIIDGDHMSIMVSMFFVYVLLSLRAGKLNHYLG